MASSATDGNEIWRQIPPEEKIDLISKAHSRGVFACLILIVLGCTLAVGFKVSALMWASFIISPLVFQFVVGKEWRALRPRIMLEYLAARTAARRYAFAARAKELSVDLIFRGRVVHEYDSELLQEAIAAMVDNVKEADVWVALFRDAVILMSEQRGGAKLEFAHLIDNKLKVEGMAPSAEHEGAQEVFLSYEDKKTNTRKKVKVTSKYPAALTVFEKKLQNALRAAGKEKDVAAVAGAAIEDLPEWAQEFEELK